MSRGSIKYILQVVDLLSRRPPLASGPESCRFITIGFSHYCEKSRWVLLQSPLKGSVVEEMHLPAMHLSTTLIHLRSAARFAPWRADTSTTTAAATEESDADSKLRIKKEIAGVPKLVLNSVPVASLSNSTSYFLDPKQNNNIKFGESANGGNIAVVVADGSSGINKILHHKFPVEMAHLYPPGQVGVEVASLERFLDLELGPTVLAWTFGNLLLTGPDYDALDSSSSSNTDKSNNRLIRNSSTRDYIIGKITESPVPTIEKVLFKLFGKRFLAPLMVKANNITADQRERSVLKVKEIFNRIDKLLAMHESSGSFHVEGKPRYLFGTPRPSAADYTLASLAIPLLFPSQTAVNFGSLEEMRQIIASETKKNKNNIGKSGSNGGEKSKIDSIPDSTIGLSRIVDMADELRKTKTGKYILNLFDTEHYNASAKRLTAQSYSLRE